MKKQFREQRSHDTPRSNRTHFKNSSKVRPSPLRNRPTRTPDAPKATCQIANACQSCAFINTKYSDGLAQKHQAGLKILEEKNLLSHAKVTQPMASPRPLGYRNQVKLVFRESSHTECGFRLGLYTPGSHNVIDTEGCPVQMPVINKWLKSFKTACIEHKQNLSFWDSKQEKGTLRYLMVRAGFRSDELQITFVCADNKLNSLLKKITRPMRENFLISGVFVNIQADPGNVILGNHTDKLWGKDKLLTRLGDFEYRLAPESFFQLNFWQAEAMYSRISSLVGSSLGHESQPIAWDLYAGQGSIAMTLASRGYRVLAIEENPHSVTAGKENFKQLTEPDSIEYLPGKVEDHIAELPAWAIKPSVVIVNPSRRGLASKVRDQLSGYLKNSPGAILIYVSCEMESLARDLSCMQEHGTKLRQIESYDMFAQTNKVEWLAMLSS